MEELLRQLIDELQGLRRDLAVYAFAGLINPSAVKDHRPTSPMVQDPIRISPENTAEGLRELHKETVILDRSPSPRPGTSRANH